jgi:hypothetical protein
MKHAELRSRRHEHPHHPHHVSALAFNVCLVVLALASAVAFLLITRDRLYAYAYSPAGARAIAARIEQLNSSLIPIEFDRQQQWDNLVASELMQRDVAAARGLLLSARSVLSPQDVAELNRRAPPGSNDARTELAALELLTPGTRARYESIVPLLSRRGNSGAASGVVSDPGALLGSQEDFEAIARAIIADPNSEPMQLVITGFHLGLGGGMTPRMTEGAAVLMMASRRPDFPQQFGAQIRALIDGSLNIDAFRSTAMAQAQGDAAGAFSISAPSFSAAVDRSRADAARAVLDKIGATSQAASRAGAVALLTHAQSLRDVPRLLLIAQAGRDRAAAAAELLPRDGALLTTARGKLTITRDLGLAMAVAGLALLGALAAATVVILRILRRIIARMRHDDYGGELVDLGSGGIRGL